MKTGRPTEEPKKGLGHTFYTKRVALGKTQEEMASYLKVSLRVYQRMEKGKFPKVATELIRIFLRLGITATAKDVAA